MSHSATSCNHFSPRDLYIETNWTDSINRSALGSCNEHVLCAHDAGMTIIGAVFWASIHGGSRQNQEALVHRLHWYMVVSHTSAEYSAGAPIESRLERSLHTESCMQEQAVHQNCFRRKCEAGPENEASVDGGAEKPICGGRGAGRRYPACASRTLPCSICPVFRIACHPRTGSRWHALAWSATHIKLKVRCQNSALPACSRRSLSADAFTLLLGLQATAQQIQVYMGVPELTIAHVKSHLQQERMHDKSQSADHHPYGSDSR